ncbi:30S ribosomal protein S20 [Thermoproteota archaeon]
MANTKTAKENIKINERNRQRNLHFRTKMKTFVKKAQTALQTKAENCEQIVKETLIILDKTVTKGIIHKNTAARKKSALCKALSKLGTVSETKPEAEIKAKPKAAAKKPSAKKTVKKTTKLTAAESTPAESKTEGSKEPAKQKEKKAESAETKKEQA